MDLYKSMLDTNDNTVRVSLEIVLYVGMLFFLFNEFRELYSIFNATGSVLGYFTDFWNIIDWSLIGLSFGALTMRILFFLRPEVQNFSPFSETIVEITEASRLYNNSFAFDAIAASFGIFKIFRFFDLQPNLLVLRRSVHRGVGDLTSFTLVLLVMIFGFSLAGMNIFGQEIEEFVNPGESFVALFLTVLGEFDFDAQLSVNIYFAYGFFLIYQVFVFLIMVNIFLAILNDAYLAIKMKFDAEDVEEGPPPLTIRQRVAKLRAWLRQQKLDQRIESLRKQQRQRELVERRAQRKVEMAKLKTLKAMGIDPEAEKRKAAQSAAQAKTIADGNEAHC